MGDEAIRPAAQSVVAPLTAAAVFMVLTVRPDTGSASTVRDVCGGLDGLVRSVGSRDPDGGLTCVLGLGSDAWDRLVGPPRPAHLHPFVEIRSGGRHAVSTPGDLLLHIRAARMDLCFELAALVMSRLDGAVDPVDEVHGFKYFDERDVIGFVDGTENPQGAAAVRATLVGAEDPGFAGGCYVIVQKYLHDLTRWNSLPVEEQERIVGRTKLSNVELPDDVKPSYAHNALTVVESGGEEVKILRDNMPFGTPSKGEFGTYFIGYSRSPEVTEQMLRNMFVGRPEGNYDRLLDVSVAVTGTLFFVPPLSTLEAMGG
ncbi:MAG: Dyp-type peroxidase [Actinomycetes bacterium]